ncbi:ABC-type transport auxiliary lipoprotein family protein [Phenylobacterium sp.]|jgi:cholesterol transport system auxiliary component|uniref:ABC-type transport auxiliary lipoprotein family protein n=1 Tax=Phenylobacterium sp. TaxID=1871053 RepID=UPI002F956A31
MTRRNALLRPALLALAAVALSGCLGGLLGGKPAQLYRFGQAPAAASDAAPAAGSVGVFRAGGTFAREAAGDKILAITGGEAQYIAQSRWAAPAEVLFNQAVLAAFDAAPGRVRLLSRGEQGRTSHALRLDVRNFETRYDNGAEAAPTVVVRVRAALARDKDQGLGPERIFEARIPAASNRVGSIVAAYDQAVGQVLGEVVRWTESQVGAG